jgi:MarR family transcriptional regulator for hemolysin
MDELSGRATELREEMLDGISDKEIESALAVFHKIMENAEKQK